MRCRALVVDAVAGAELVDVCAELQVHRSVDDDEQLLGVAVRIRLVAGRAARLETRDDDLERMERLRCQERLAAELTPRDVLPGSAPEYAGLWRARGEEIGDGNAERGREPLERRDRRVRAPALELAHEALAQARRGGDLLQRLAT